MEKRFLQRQLVESSLYYASERRRVRKIKINIVLIAMIAGVCVGTHYINNQSVSKYNDSTKQQNLNVPPNQALSKFSLSQMA